MKPAPAALLLIAACRLEARVGDFSDDHDADGFTVRQGDCDDEEPLVAPGFEERCDGLDNDCSGAIDGDVCHRGQEFVQGSVLDVLFVVDDSASMGEERRRMATAVFQFVTHAIQPYQDSHIGVITGDAESPAAGVLRNVDGARWVDATFDRREANGWLRRAFDVGPVGPSQEKPRAAIQWALDEHLDGPNFGFLRDDADLAVIILSDEDDATVNPDIATFLDWVRALKASRQVTVHAIVGLPGDDDCAGGVGYDHLTLVDRTEGTKLSVCEVDYGPFLFALGQVVTLAARQDLFPLDFTPTVETLEVEIEAPGELPVVLVRDLDFTLLDTTNEVSLLGDPPPLGSRITIRYERVPRSRAEGGA